MEGWKHVTALTMIVMTRSMKIQVMGGIIRLPKLAALDPVHRREPAHHLDGMCAHHLEQNLLETTVTASDVLLIQMEV